MGRRHEGGLPNLDELILECLERATFQSFKQIASYTGKIARELGNEPWAENTIRNHLDHLDDEQKIRHQEAGYFIDRGWKEGQPKAFILVEVAKPAKRGENCQKKLIEEIREEFRKGGHTGLNLISVDVVLGAEFSVIVQVYSDNLHFIGRFVKEYLLASPLVVMTRTIMVWPMESQPAR